MAAGAGRSHSYSFAAAGVRAGKLELRIWPRAWSEKNKCFVVGVDNAPDGQAFAEHALHVELGAEQEASRARLASTALFEGPGAMPALPVPNFLGRSADLDALRRALASESAAVCVVASGIGGIGKTTLVRQFVATEAAQLFHEGAAWIDATALPSELGRVAQRFGWKSERLPTIELLGLNEREHLVEARQDTFQTAESVLLNYVDLKRKGAEPGAIAAKRQAIVRQPHRTVWEEMKRQRHQPRRAKLRALFEAAPEALSW
jgi:hypothetical protein